MNENIYISRKEQAKLTKKKIFDTTMLLIKKRGYSKITIREICQSAQISIGTFYLYFSSKDEILLEIYNKIDQKVKFPPGGTPDGIIPCIINDFKIYLRCMSEAFSKELLREIYRISLLSGENAFLSPERPLFGTVLDVLRTAGENASLLSEDPPELLCRKCHMFVQSYIFQWLVDDNLDAGFLTADCMGELAAFLTLYIKH